jgi:hypothetical protein
LPPSGRRRRARPKRQARFLAPARRWWPALSPVGRLVLLHHAGRNAPALTDRQAVLLRAGPDITGALPPGRGPPRPARRSPPRAAGVLNIGRELLAERRRVLGAQVNLIIGAVKGKPHCLLGRATGQIVFQHDGYFLRRLPSRPSIVLAPYRSRCPLPRPATPQIRCGARSSGTPARQRIPGGRPSAVPLRSVTRANRRRSASIRLRYGRQPGPPEWRCYPRRKDGSVPYFCAPSRGVAMARYGTCGRPNGPWRCPSCSRRDRRASPALRAWDVGQPGGCL